MPTLDNDLVCTSVSLVSLPKMKIYSTNRRRSSRNIFLLNQLSSWLQHSSLFSHPLFSLACTLSFSLSFYCFFSTISHFLSSHKLFSLSPTKYWKKSPPNWWTHQEGGICHQPRDRGVLKKEGRKASKGWPPTAVLLLSPWWRTSSPKAVDKGDYKKQHKRWRRQVADEQDNCDDLSEGKGAEETCTFPCLLSL